MPRSFTANNYGPASAKQGRFTVKNTRWFEQVDSFSASRLLLGFCQRQSQRQRRQQQERHKQGATRSSKTIISRNDNLFDRRRQRMKRAA